MLSYTTGRTLYGQLTNDASTANLSTGDTLINNAIKQVLSARTWPFMEKSATGVTVASQQYVVEPGDIRKLYTVTITSGTYQWRPREAPDREYWDALNLTTTLTSNIPQWYYRQQGRTYFWPTPSVSDQTVTWYYEKNFKDLSIADYTTGTITTIATSGITTTITGSGTSWTSAMVGRYIRVSESNTVANNGDEFWYEIATVPSSTTLTLVKTYQGVALSTGGASYTIAQLSPIPEAYQMLPIFRACQFYYSAKDQSRSQYFKEMADSMFESLQGAEGSKSNDPGVGLRNRKRIYNPNFYWSE